MKCKLVDVFAKEKLSGNGLTIFYDFAGHPLIGLAAHLHEEFGQDESHTWHVKLNTKTVKLKTTRLDSYFEAAMEQGKALIADNGISLLKINNAA